MVPVADHPRYSLPQATLEVLFVYIILPHFYETLTGLSNLFPVYLLKNTVIMLLFKTFQFSVCHKLLDQQNTVVTKLWEIGGVSMERSSGTQNRERKHFGATPQVPQQDGFAVTLTLTMVNAEI